MWARTGVLAALALVLSYLETFIPLPVPIPGAKLGLANVPVLLALVLLDARSALAVALVKTLAAGVLFGSPLMIPYSAAGTLLAFLGMFSLLRLRGISVVLVSVAGSLLHIVGQLAVAWLMLGTPLVFYTFPLLGVIACATGALTGKMAAYLVDALRGKVSAGCGIKVRAGVGARADCCSEKREGAAFGRKAVRRGVAAKVDVRVLLAALLAYFCVVLAARGALALGACSALGVACALFARVTPKEVARAFGPLLSILVITTLAQVLYVQQGTVLVEAGPIAITSEALVTVAVMMVRLVCLMLTSIAFSRVVEAGELVSALAFYLRPLQRVGVRTDAFLLSLELAFQFLPVLLSEFKRLKDERFGGDVRPEAGGVRQKLRSYQGIVAELAVSSFAYADYVATQYGQEGPGSGSSA